MNLYIRLGRIRKVYKGQISIEDSSHFVAIKRLDSMSNQGAAEFKAEIEMLSKLRHCNLVSLIGYCDDNRELILAHSGNSDPEYFYTSKLTRKTDHVSILGLYCFELQSGKLAVDITSVRRSKVVAKLQDFAGTTGEKATILRFAGTSGIHVGWIT
ncbi:receptor-like protein kinase FERONIA [Tanacetum coccineum]